MLYIVSRVTLILISVLNKRVLKIAKSIFHEKQGTETMLQKPNFYHVSFYFVFWKQNIKVDWNFTEPSMILFVVILVMISHNKFRR